MAVWNPCHSNLRRLTHIVRSPINTRQTEMKTKLIQIIYANPFARLDKKDPYIHLTKFYELAGTLREFEAEE